MEIDEIILKAQKGDVPSYEWLYKHYSEKIYRFIYFMGVSREDAEELCNDVFIHVYKKFDIFMRESRKDK